MITTKDSCWLLLRLAILLGVVLVQSSEGASYQDFANSHIDYPKTRAPNPNVYCNVMMARRRLNARTCKPTNTFINSSPSSIQQICRTGGTRFQGNLFDSRRRFSVVVCRNTGRFPRCSYVGRRQIKRLRVACTNNRPVHFERLL
ncbi:ribonuclease pancreatic-like [Rhineura floridana]|uniref:ribonuclease pancreatic-like n=1 Tax=Rhineura floridana TaxID=261503 RepID=UPI002AC80E51|nr:ribonuclease pancreatic-like [Rhineura floridana]